MLIVDKKENPMPIRQAAAVALKNLTAKHWREKKNSDLFIISPEDKSNVKGNILDAIIRSADEKKVR